MVTTLAGSATRTQYAQWRRRFERFQATRPGAGLDDDLRIFLLSLPVSGARVARSALKWYYPAVDWHQLPRPRYRRAVGQLARTILTPDEIAHLRSVLPDTRAHAAIECLWTLRRAEVAALAWGSLDLGRALAYLVGKGNKDAVTAILPTAVAALAAWFDESGGPADSDPVFPGANGQPITPKLLHRWVCQWLEAADLTRPRRACHAFRRTFASRYLEAYPEDLAGLRELLRHEHLNTTLLYVFFRSDVFAARLARLRL